MRVLCGSVDIIVTPEANVGIKIGGGKLAHGDYDSSDNAFHYRFGAYLLYNLGYKAKANILGFIDWALAPRKAFTPDNTVTLYEKKGAIPMSSSDMETRDLSLDSAIHRRQGSEALSINATMPYLDAAMGLTRREDGSADNPNDSEFSLPGSYPPGTSGFQVPEIRFNCAHLSRLKLTGARASNQGKTAEQNNWHGQCLIMIGDMSSNWKMLDADTAKNDDVEDFWVPWRNDMRNNDKESWTFKRDYRATWITDGSKPDDWWNFVSRRWYSEGYEGDAGGEAIFCAMNHFGQDNVYKLETEKGKKYNGFCLRNDGSGMASDWQQMHNLGKCLITFGNTQGQTPDSTNTKRDS
ncbi:hypothetical protein N7447_008802 [Penicillium robsamsonii]|uniref:uncharacterized protein n=1 Tax=Penicillium robsamsonii TaxID=1792511 RepID=UPI0025477AF1|nr:uncharacterized protein N7447_008802 [Penicillium robsamsonii]KAJ5816569.1 hypothetical protein N7447_008802 [Penicillium robsamsonii]